MDGQMLLVFTLGTVMAGMACGEKSVCSQWKVEQSWDIAEVPSEFPVGFCLLTHGNRQYVAYFDKARQMSVAFRTTDSDEWQYRTLPSKIGWDSHNYVTMAVDRDGHLHVSGNMHCVPLVYFRTEKAGNIATLKPYSMTGRQEDRVTYPSFLFDHNNELIFTYRNGGSGNGINLYNKYDVRERSWSRLLAKPLFDGEEQRNAYPHGPIRGPRNWFHVVWVWRDTPDCATNHHLGYARSRNLLDWESVFGEQVELPLTLGETKLWVDPIPSHGGIINGCQNLFFDAHHQPIITYHKADRDGNMQIYAARPEHGQWNIRRLTEWNKHIPFSGGGCMGFIGISISGLSRAEPGILTMTYRHRDYGGGRLVIDEKTLRPLKKTIKVAPKYPTALNVVESQFDGMQIRRSLDSGRPSQKSVRYILQWETLGANRDLPREPPLPAPSTLRLYKLVANAE
jgi:hypothetical protein